MAKYPRGEADVEALDLDLNNPRIHERATQTQAMAAVLKVELEGEKVYALAEKICEMEGLDPGDAIYVTASTTHPGRFIVLDGNRRLTALRLLSGAATIDFDALGIGSALAGRFKKLALSAAGRWPTSAEIVTFPDKETARQWIRLRHTGENGGAGRSSWNALQIDIFDNNGSWHTVKDLWEANALSNLVITQLQNHSFEITTLERFVRTRAAYGLFGFNIDDNTVDWGDKPVLAKQAVARLADAVALGEITSRTHEKTAAIEELLKKLHTELTKPPLPPEPAPGEGRDMPPPYKPGNHDPDTGKADTDRPQPTGAPGSLDDAPPVDSAGRPAGGQTEEPNPPKPPRQPRKKIRLIQKNEFQWVTDPKCRAVVREMRDELEYADTPYACAMLARTMLELTCHHYLVAYDITPPGTRTAMITKAGEHLKHQSEHAEPRDKAAMATALIRHSDAYGSLSEAAHSPAEHYHPGTVKAEWDTISPSLEIMWQRITNRRQRGDDAAGQRSPTQP